MIQQVIYFTIQSLLLKTNKKQRSKTGIILRYSNSKLLVLTIKSHWKEKLIRISLMKGYSYQKNCITKLLKMKRGESISLETSYLDNK